MIRRSLHPVPPRVALHALPLGMVLVGGSLVAPRAVRAQDSSAAYTEPYQREALELFRTAIGYRTAAGHGQVPALAGYLAERFRAGGFPASDVHVLPIALPGGEETAGLVVRYRGDGSSGKKPILLMAHLDVVEALPEDWERDPFTLIEEDGYFFGRGTLDDKFGVVALSETFLRLKREGFLPTRDLILSFSGDEETGQVSTRALATDYRALTDAEFALNADAGGGALGPQDEGLYFEIQTSEKTYATYELTVRNPGGHSSTPRSDNAIYELATALKNIQAYRFPVMTNETTLAFFRQSAEVTPGPVGEAMRRFAADPTDEDAVETLWNQPEYVGVTRTTCVATMLRGGHAENALPQSATATVNCRIFPGVAVDDVRRTLFDVADNPELEIRVLDDPVASPMSPMREDVRSAVAEAVESRYPGAAIIPYMAPYGTDGKETRAAGIPTYGVMGLFIKRDEVFAHGLNERVPVRSFFGALDHWHTILTSLAGR